jgi:gamma-butyrobetaine dioxygenase
MQDIQSSTAAGELMISSLAPGDGGLTLGWSDGHQSFFHAIWLRDCCYCEHCGDSYSSKRFLVPHQIAVDTVIDRAEIDPQGNLEIHWRPQAHVSRYDASWLRSNCYDDEARRARFHQPFLWRAGIIESIPTVDFKAARDDDDQRMGLYRKLRDFGLVHITSGPAEPGAVEVVAKLIGGLGESAYTPIFDLSPSSPMKTMGNTYKEVAPHTDEAFRYTPPGINILGCVRPADDGGESILVDGFAVAEQLRQANPEAFELLCRYGQTFNRIHPGQLDQRGRQRMIALDDRGEVIGIRVHTRSAGPLNLPRDLVEPYYRAHQAFCALMMSPEFQLRFQLGAGEAVMFDNHRVLHARAEFGDPRRFLQICNVSRETFHERLRLLAAKLGLDAEANQVLAAGMSS